MARVALDVRSWFIGLCLGSATLACAPRSLAAQSVDVIRGVVVGPDSQPVANAQITITVIDGSASRSTRTDAAGRYTITFPGIDGDYWVSVTALGLAPKRFEVKRLADEALLVANAKLSMAAVSLAPMRVQLPRQRVSRDDTLPDVGGTERQYQAGNLTVDQLGSLAAMAASIPGVQFLPGNGAADGFSVLGLPSDQNISSLDGLLGVGRLPRDAAVTATLATSPFDVSIGGFSGGRLNVQTRAGTNTIVRTVSGTFDDPAMQWTDRAGRALGQPYQTGSAGGVVSGAFRPDNAFYNISYQFNHRVSDLRDLLAVDQAGLIAAGIAPDSVARLAAILRAAGIPASVGRTPRDRLGELAIVLGNLSFNPPFSTTGQTFGVTFSGSVNRSTPSALSIFEMPAHGADFTALNGGVQLRHSNFYGPLLSETTVGASGTRSAADPYFLFPNIDVRVASALPDGTTDVSSVEVGGNPSSRQPTTSDIEQLSNDLSWFSEDNRHRIKWSTQLRREGFHQDFTTNALGTFTFNSLADLEGLRPASFSRTLRGLSTSASQYVGAVALGDYFRPAADLQLQYGIRLDGNRFAAPPPENEDVERRFGVRNSTTPAALSVSPRAGFAWTYGSVAEASAAPGAARTPRAVVRGGVGVFQGTPTTTSLGGPLSNTGTDQGVGELLCTGTAAPVADWAGYSSSISAIPSTCKDGANSNQFAGTSPNVVLFAPGYSAPRSVRANVQWTGPALGNRFIVIADATASWNRSQPGNVDLNFDGTPHAFLSAEGDRPLFADLSDVSASTGAIAPTAARGTAEFSHVSELRSDLSSRSRQLSVRVQPAQTGSRLAWSVAYVYQSTHDQAYGFASAGGDPRTISSARSALDSRHQLVYNLGVNPGDWVRVMWFGQFRSGLPYTPLVVGDINGDGYSNDRAFVFDPARATDTAVAAAMRALIAHGSSSARDCLSRQLGQIAQRNSCEAPWFAAATMTATLNSAKLRLPARTSVSLQLNNPLGAADLALHGQDGLHGWGQPAIVSPALLFVRGFNPASHAFRYDVNERFGSPDIAQGALKIPVALTAIVRVDLGPPRERQALLRLLDRGRKSPGPKATPDVLRVLYAGGGVYNPMTALLRSSDTLRLSVQQADSLALLNQLYSSSVDSIWAPIAATLGALPRDYDERAAYRAYVDGRKHTVDLLISYVGAVTGLLTDHQRRQLSPVLGAYLDDRYLRSIRSGTLGFNEFAGPAAAPATGGGGVVSVSR